MMTRQAHRTLQETSQLTCEAPINGSKITETGLFDFMIELLEAIIPASPDPKTPATPIIIHERWEPAQLVNAHLQHENENLVSYRWLQEHISERSQYILKDGKKILLVWRFLWGSCKFRTTHQVVRFDGVYALVFNRNRPSYSPHVESLFEEVLAAHMQRHLPEQMTLLKRWKYQALLKLKYYLQYIGIHIWQQQDVQEPSRTRHALDFDDKIVPLGDLSCAKEDADWVYVTILDMESNSGEVLAPESSSQCCSQNSGQCHEATKASTDTSAPKQEPRLVSHKPFFERSHSIDTQFPTRKASYRCHTDGGHLTWNNFNFPEPTTSANEEDPAGIIGSTYLTPFVDALSLSKLGQRNPSTCENLSQEMENLATTRSTPRKPEASHAQISLRQLRQAQSELDSLLKALDFHRGRRNAVNAVRGRSKSAPTIGRGNSHFYLSTLGVSVDNNNQLFKDTHTEYGVREVSTLRRRLASSIHSDTSSPNCIPCDSSHTYKSESQFKFDSDEIQPSFTTATSFDDAIESDVFMNNQQADECPTCPSWAEASNPLPLTSQHCHDQISLVSSVSSEGTEIPFPDDYWTWSDENSNFFHLVSKSDGTEEKIWYPQKFS